MTNTMTYRTLLSLLQQLDERELDLEVVVHNSNDGTWTRPHGILVDVIDRTGEGEDLEVVLEDGLLEEFQGKMTRTPIVPFFVKEIRTLSCDVCGESVPEDKMTTDTHDQVVCEPCSKKEVK